MKRVRRMLAVCVLVSVAGAQFLAAQAPQVRGVEWGGQCLAAPPTLLLPPINVLSPANSIHPIFFIP